MIEVVGAFTHQRVGATFFQGSKPIGGVWATSNILVSNACIMPAGYGIKDHQLFVINFCTQDIISSQPPCVVQATSCCLNIRIPHIVAEYVRILEEKVIQHCLIEWVGKAHTSSRSRRKLAKRINKIDWELGDYMQHDEKKCQRIKLGRIPFSSKASFWIKQTQVYQSLLKYHAGKIRNQGNLKRAARQCKIKNMITIPLEEITARLSTCIDMCDHFRKHGQPYRRKHLQRCLLQAREKDDKKAEKQILAIIQQEKDRSFWRRINYVLGKHISGSCFKVQVPQEDVGVVEHTTQDNLQDAT
jgi:hypothetical protein